MGESPGNLPPPKAGADCASCCCPGIIQRPEGDGLARGRGAGRRSCCGAGARSPGRCLRKRDMKPFRVGPALAGGLGPVGPGLPPSVPAGCKRIVGLDTSCLADMGDMSMTSCAPSSWGMAIFFARKVPRRLRIRWLTVFLDTACIWTCPDAAEDDRRGMVSTLVDANSRRGVDI